MSEEKPTLHIDNDWKRQAQEEKCKLAEAEQKRKEEEEKLRSAGQGMPPIGGAPGMPIPPTDAGTGEGPTGRAGGAASAGRGAAQASLATLVQSILTQVLFYLGELAPRGAEPQINLDMAKMQIDLLGVIEEKTKGNLTPDEQRLLDNALYEVRMRYVSIASQYATV